MTYHNIQQGTGEWLNLRRGKFTASTFKNLMMGKTTQGYMDEIYRVVFEKLTGESPESFKSDYMQRGNDLEPHAKESYMMETFSVVEDSGFFELNKYVGCSPDGLIDDNGQIEIKCPKYSTMIKYLLDKKLPNEYIYQVQGQLWVTGREWCDFVAFHPKLPMFILRVYPDKEIIKKLEKEINIAINEVEKIIKQISGE